MSDYLYNAISVLGEIDKEKYEELKAYFCRRAQMAHRFFSDCQNGKGLYLYQRK